MNAVLILVEAAIPLRAILPASYQKPRSEHGAQ